MSIFDEYISSETEIDLQKMQSVYDAVTVIIDKYKAQNNPKYEKDQKDLEYLRNYIVRSQKTIKIDQDINRELSAQNARLEAENVQLKAELKNQKENFTELLEKWNQNK